jgi:hypothetical protein
VFLLDLSGLFQEAKGKKREVLFYCIGDDSYLPPVDIVKAVIRDALYFDLKEYVQRLEILQ